MPTKPNKNLETFDNPHPERDYRIEITIPEFTCLCPKTGQPDFATLFLEYIADEKCVELKSLKQYIWSYRNEGAFHEAVTNKILNDLVAATAPRYMQLRAEFNVRGGIYTAVTVQYRAPNWQATQPTAPTTVSAAPNPTTPTRSGTRAPAPAPHAEAPAITPPAETGKRAGAGGSRFRMLQRAKTPAARASAGNDDEPEPAPPSTPTPVAVPTAGDEPALYLGIDIGTSGCCAVVIDRNGRLVHQAQAPIPVPIAHNGQVTQDPNVWWKSLTVCLQQLGKLVDLAQVRAIAVDATSGTLLLCDAQGTPLAPALMYNDTRAQAEAATIAEIAERHSGAHGASSALAKLLWLHNKGLDKKAAHCLHQADWVVGKLCGLWGVSDYHNALKLGYDAEGLRWPAWLKKFPLNTELLPRVQAPAAPVATVTSEVAAAFGFRLDTQVLSGTTDGVAAFLAAGALHPGQAVTSLGSTLVLKLMSDKPVFSPEHGVYSHRLGSRWLVGGASNTGGAALLQYFKLEQIKDMTALLDPDKPTGLEYYPLAGVGERFPIYDLEMTAVLEPLPGDSVTFFQGMLEGIARVEAQGYRLLAKLGAPTVKEVFTTGGGSENAAWQRIRQRLLGVEMRKPRSRLAAYGTALLAAGLGEREIKVA